MSDHGSLTCSFRVTITSLQDQGLDGGAPVTATAAAATAAAAVAAAGDSIGPSDDFVAASDRGEARGGRGGGGGRSETAVDWVGGDDGHYGLR